MIIYLIGNCVEKVSRGAILWKEAPEARLAVTEAEDKRHGSTENHDIDTSTSALDTRARPTAGVAEPSDGFHLRGGTRYRVEALRTVSVADMEVVKEPAQRRNPGLKSRMDATRYSVVEGVDAAISGLVAD